VTDASTAALITAVASLIVAIGSGVIAVRNNNKSRANSLEIQKLKGAINDDLERLKAKLSHGQIVSSTQWNAEFKSYQDIWKGMVAIRTLATKIVLREEELVELGLPIEYLASAGRTQIRKDLIQKFAEASKDLLVAIHESAPFYPEPIRQAANHTHQAAKALFDWQMKALGQFVAEDEQFANQNKVLLLAVVEGTNHVETLIRDRLAEVEVVSERLPGPHF
jgi:hypothetical protein